MRVVWSIIDITMDKGGQEDTRSRIEVYIIQAHKQRGEREREREKKEKQTDRGGVEKTPFFNFPYTKSNSLPPSNITSLQFTVHVFFPSAVALLLHTSSINLLTAMTLPTTSTSCCSSISLRKACWLG